MEMEMEASGGRQNQSHPIPGPGVDVTKRERKRSRYLSPPYTDTDVQEKKAAGDGSQEEGPPHVSASEVLSALRAAALGQGQPGMDAAALRFLAMYSSNRSRSSVFVDDSHAAAAGGGSEDDGGDKPPSAGGIGRKKVLNLNAGLDDGSLAKKKKKKKKNPHPNPPVITTATPPTNNEKKKKRKMNKRTAGHVGNKYNPVALVLELAQGTPLPSREDLLSTFSRFGFVIDSETTIIQDKHTARAVVAFATRAQAESALTYAATLFAASRSSLQDLPPITPLPKLPLTDIRNNLGKMILSLSSKAPQEANAKTAVSLVGEMRHLLAKVDKVLQVQAAAAATAHHA